MFLTPDLCELGKRLERGYEQPDQKTHFFGPTMTSMTETSN